MKKKIETKSKQQVDLFVFLCSCWLRSVYLAPEFQFPCLGTCAALRFMLWADRGFMAHSSPIPPQDSAPLPAAVKTTHSYPAEHQVVHRGELLRNSAQFWPKGFASCPSSGDKNAKYNAERCTWVVKVALRAIKQQIVTMHCGRLSWDVIKGAMAFINSW